MATTECAGGGGAGTAGRGHGRLSRSVLARPPSPLPRPPPPEEPWVSRKDWRRALAIAIERRLTKAELRELLARLARVRRGAEPPPASPRLQLVRGGKRGPAGPPFPGTGPVSKEAA